MIHFFEFQTHFWVWFVPLNVRHPALIKWYLRICNMGTLYQKCCNWRLRPSLMRYLAFIFSNSSTKFLFFLERNPHHPHLSLGVRFDTLKFFDMLLSISLSINKIDVSKVGYRTPSDKEIVEKPQWQKRYFHNSDRTGEPLETYLESSLAPPTPLLWVRAPPPPPVVSLISTPPTSLPTPLPASTSPSPFLSPLPSSFNFFHFALFKRR